ncbi:hypothetical protein ACFSE1_10140 [Rhizobium helianthi]|uniref:Uncharacterized protein n=1 Tax=Rhizobium helianthi TaxID=1132695 RepID=A0ABW4M3H2_9HYPH
MAFGSSRIFELRGSREERQILAKLLQKSHSVVNHRLIFFGGPKPALSFS